MKDTEANDPIEEQKPAEKPADSKVASEGEAPLMHDHEEKELNEAHDEELVQEDQPEDEDPKEDPKEDSEEIPAELEAKEEGQKQESEVKPEEAQVNYSLLSKEDLVKLLKEKLDHPGRGNLRRDVEGIREAFYTKHNLMLEEKKEHFLKEGGIEEDFKPVGDPLESEVKDLLTNYKGQKAEYTRQLEKSKKENLEKKQEVLEGFRLLMEGQESFDVTFRKFKDLQRQWFAAGVVPQQNLKDLWDSYNYFVEKFNDYVRINRDLRALDLKKNLEIKEQVCEKTEELEKESNVVQAFKTLQKYHAQWREIGPVPKENRDEIWERFKKATSVINKKHQEYHSKLKDSLFENLEKKKALCEKVEAISLETFTSHASWVDKTKDVLDIQKEWKTIGYAPKKDNNAIYARFRAACDAFFGSKAAFYASAFEEQKENLKLKSDIAEQAEALSESTDWKETTHKLIQLQKEWKQIGPVPRRDSDKLWRRFRAACDAFFNNKTKFFSEEDVSFENNLKAKEALIEEMRSYNPTGERKKDLAALTDFQNRFDDLGFVPSVKKEQIKEQFRVALDEVLASLGLSETDQSVFRFRNRVRSLSQSPRSEMKLNFERDKLSSRLQQLKSDIGVWENNIGFFKQSDSSEETLQGFHEKIESARERIKALELKIRIIDDMENEN